MTATDLHLTNTRYNYFDALRGFSMVLVVFWHIMLCSIGSTDGINLVTNSFMLNLFFFISGFFAYKPFALWNNSLVKYTLKSRVKVLLVGTSVFIILHSIFFANRLPRLSGFTYAVDGYWFTLLLLRCYILYIATVVICRNIVRYKIVFWSIITLMTMICVFLHHNFMQSADHLYTSMSTAMTHIISPRLFYFFPYFAFGLLARAYLPIFEKLLYKDYAKIVILLLIIFLWALCFLTDSTVFTPANLNGDSLMAYPIGIPSLILVIQFFYSIRHVFDRDSRFSKGIRLIGRRTLDIYFLHYFFLPDLHFLKPYLSSGNPALLQLIIGLPIAMIIVGITLLVGQVIRMSPVLAEWLLGVKNKHHARQNPGIEGNQIY